MTVAAPRGRVPLNVRVVIGLLLFAPLGIPAIAFLDLFSLPPLATISLSGTVGLLSSFCVIMILSRLGLDAQRGLSDAHDVDLRKSVKGVAEGFANDMGVRFDALCQNLEKTEASLKERQEIYLKLQVKVAEEAMKSLHVVQQSAAEQSAVQADMTAFLNQAPAALQELRAQIDSWSRIDPVEIDAIQHQLTDRANALSDLITVFRGNAQASDDAIVALSLAAEKSSAAAEKVCCNADDGADAAGAIIARMESIASDMTEAREDITRLVSGSRAGIMRALKGVVESKNSLGKTTVAIEDMTRALSGSVRAIECGLDANEAAFSAATTSIAEQSEACFSKIADGAHNMLHQARDAVMLAADQAVSTVREPIGQIETATQRHAEAVDGHVKALAGHGAVLARSSKALQAVEAMTDLVERQSRASAAACERRLQEQDTLLAPMAALVEPAQQTLAQFAQLNVSAYAKALGSVEALAAKLADAKHEDHSSAFTALHDAIAALHDELSPQFGSLSQQLSTLTQSIEALAQEDYEVLKDDLSAVFKEGYDGLNESVQALPAAVAAPLQEQLDTLAGALQPADQLPLFDALGHRIEAHVDAALTHVAQTHEAAVDQAFQAAKAAGALKTQLKTLSSQSAKQHESLQADLKHLRSRQIQSLKHSIKSVPEAVAKQLAPGIDAHVRGLQEQLKAALERAPLLEQPADAQLDVEPSQEDVAASLGARLKAALTAMDDIEADAAGFAAAALAAPDEAGASQVFAATLEDADTVLNGWGNKLGNVATAIALARDAS
ncbi:MAG: hypothetical protein AAF221_05950 [Pseudomonadota bacterium]